MDQLTEKLPFAIKDLEPELSAKLQKYFNYSSSGLVQVGPKKYLLPYSYKTVASDFYNMVVRETDIFVASVPRSGTTWTQELVWMVTNDMDYEGAQSALSERYEALEHSIYEQMFFESKLDRKDSPNSKTRYFKTHLPITILPPHLLDSARMVYVARDPRDVAVSSFYIRPRCYDFKTHWNIFSENLYCFSPYFESVKEAWHIRHHPNMLFLFYEELSRDLPAAIHRVSKFFGKTYSEEQVHRLAKHLHISNFKKNEAVNAKGAFGPHKFPESDKIPHIREGKVGDWRKYFDKEMTEQAEKWMTENLKDTDLKFPQMENEQDED